MAVHQTRYILRETLRYDIQYPAELVLTSITLSRFCISIPRRVSRIFGFPTHQPFVARPFLKCNWFVYMRSVWLRTAPSGNTASGVARLYIFMFLSNFYFIFSPKMMV